MYVIVHAYVKDTGKKHAGALQTNEHSWWFIFNNLSAQLPLILHGQDKNRIFQHRFSTSSFLITLKCLHSL
jgi:hypothetical protein